MCGFRQDFQHPVLGSQGIATCIKAHTLTNKVRVCSWHLSKQMIKIMAVIFHSAFESIDKYYQSWVLKTEVLNI